MSNDSSPLNYMGTQSRETVAMAAALAERQGDQAMAAVVDASSDASAAGSRIGAAASRAVGKVLDKAKGTLHAAAEQARDRAATAAAAYTRKEPVRATLIAAGTGALLMALLAMMARSGVRRVKRKIRR